MSLSSAAAQRGLQTNTESGHLHKVARALQQLAAGGAEAAVPGASSHLLWVGLAVGAAVAAALGVLVWRLMQPRVPRRASRVPRRLTPVGDRRKEEVALDLPAGSEKSEASVEEHHTSLVTRHGLKMRAQASRRGERLVVTVTGRAARMGLGWSSSAESTPPGSPTHLRWAASRATTLRRAL